MLEIKRQDFKTKQDPEPSKPLLCNFFFVFLPRAANVQPGWNHFEKSVAYAVMQLIIWGDSQQSLTPGAAKHWLVCGCKRGQSSIDMACNMKHG